MSFLSHNFIYILYLNFKLLPLKQAVKLPIDVYGRIQKSSIRGKVKIIGDIKTGMIKFGSQFDLFPKTPVVLDIHGIMEIHGSCYFCCGSTIHIGSNGILKIGNLCGIGSRTFIYCDRFIEIGNCVDISWDCQIMDTDTHIMIDLTNGKELQYENAVKIGDFVWIGNHVLLNKGTILSSGTIVGSYSLCNKNYSEFSNGAVIAGIPAKCISVNRKRKWEKKYLRSTQ